MRCVQCLPEGYQKIYEVDLQKNARLAAILNILAAVFGVVMGVVMHLFVPIGTLFSMEDGLTAYIIRFAVLVAGIIVYIIAHEWVHGKLMRSCGAKQVQFGFTGMYAYAGSKEDYFGKKAYLLIALAPLVIWGVVLLVLNVLVPQQWFWVVYVIQIINVTGAIGDLFVTGKFAGMPSDILVNDDGVSMRVYSREG